MGKLSKEELKKFYDEWHTPTENEKSDIVRRSNKDRLAMLSFLKPERGKRLLDVGCGKGLFLSVAESRGVQAYGVDISKTAVERARIISPACKIVIGLGEELPWKDNYFDYVTCFGSLEHFIDPAKAVREMVRVLRPEGKALILVPNSFFIGHIYMAYRYGIPPDAGGQLFSERFGTKEEWRELLEQNGLKVIKVKAHNGFFTSKKVSLWVNLAYNLVRPLIPFNLAADFIFLCTKREELESVNR
ncbi:methyltransferase domain-containing protein [Dehalococcoidia bacterium]|nr:methyltransferase domain-containing protein [Dehalococcoidia bacterium]